MQKINGIEIVNQENFDTYSRWLGRQLTSGVMVAGYDCPHCAVKLFSHVPAKGDSSDSLSTCPVCDKIYFKVVNFQSDNPAVVTNLLSQVKI